MYEHTLTLKSQRLAARVDIYLVNEDGSRGRWVGALVKMDRGEFSEHGLVPPEMRRSFEDMLRSN